ncbi:HAD family hydrolase [Clostridium carboxidivorans P7]|uniref:HAD-superfamily subfamily IB hydrolase, TIGR01490 n=1 Tax=Clostridium carboxidivorans P7 TaxID=536227 RepID=C6PPL3_9CLOT|nr:HAD-IB family hydrolase [Clostridium carboxidivorans]AKN33896.1 HAD family hydrolase [Clostridium carboxidivorans P7]EET88907.1 HAD-superfamily subfamily IB hydrolase, TIGR01490 [Clostridium carboxidivorans P7]EFG88236.1 HAD hydrolase, family IB [Clostridium carboxidivorans P7]
MERLAIFDVDYTLTKRETLMEFYLFMLKKDPKLIIHLPKSFVSVLSYAFKVLEAGKAKENFISFIDGIEEIKMKRLVEEFYRTRLSKIFYKDAIDTIKKLKAEGCKIYLISASAEFYLDELYNIKEVDMVIGTRFTCENGKYRRKIVGENCKGEEKVKRLMEVLKKENVEVDFKNSYMFSDSLSDMPLFNLVGNPFLINYKKGHDKIKILNWK